MGKLVTTKSTMVTEVVRDSKYQYLTKKIWRDSKSVEPNILTIIMLKPSENDVIAIDNTTRKILLNVAKMKEVNELRIVNIFCSVEGLTSNEQNDKIILTSVQEASKVIYAVGSAGDTNKAIKAREEEVYKIIEPFVEKVYIITDGINRSKGYNPMCNKIKEWHLVKI